jgi:sugar lactone lactonase YvrE
VFRIDAAGLVRHLAGKIGPCGFSGDGGPATEAVVCQVWDARRDAEGRLYVADTNNNRVRRIDAGGTITTFAGSGPVNGLERYGAGSTCGDGGRAIDACVNTPYGLAFDDDGNLFVCENEGRIRRIDQSGTITTLVAERCTKLAWAFGSLFSVAGDHVSRISRSGDVAQLTATGLGFSGDGGPASNAVIFALKQSHGLAVDREGNLFFVDGDNLRVRAIRFGAVLAPPGARVRAAAEGTAILATVTAANGRPAEGVRVDFLVPQSGASCTLSNAFAVTERKGVATVACTPNCIAGGYAVTVRPLAADAVAAVNLANPSGPCRRRSVRH